jgi:hypothetical protein
VEHQLIRYSLLADTQFRTNVGSADVASSVCPSDVLSLLNSPSKVALVRGLQRPEAQKLINGLDQVSRSSSSFPDGLCYSTQVLTSSHLDVNLWRRGLRFIRKVSGKLRILPSSYVLLGECIPIGKVRIDRKSAFVTDGAYQGHIVAIKCFDMNEEDSDRVFKVPLMKIVLQSPSLSFRSGVLSRGHHMEIFIPSKHFASAGCFYFPRHTLLAHSHRVDGQR